ncbi:MAG: metallophosphoesterase family protein [Thermoplasmatota archaeon]
MVVLAVLSDIHSNLPALRAVLAELERFKPELILHAGDLVGYYTFPNEVLELARERGFVSIRGNHDRAVLSGDVSWFSEDAAEAALWNRSRLAPASSSFLRALPDRLRLTIGGRRLLMVHGSPRDDDEYVLPTPPERWPFSRLDAELLIMGHTHIPWTARCGGLTVLNPGAVGQPRDGDPRASFAVVDSGDLSVRIVRTGYDVRRTASAAREHGLPGRLSQRLYRGL